MLDSNVAHLVALGTRRPVDSIRLFQCFRTTSIAPDRTRSLSVKEILSLDSMIIRLLSVKPVYSNHFSQTADNSQDKLQDTNCIQKAPFLDCIPNTPNRNYRNRALRSERLASPRSSSRRTRRRRRFQQTIVRAFRSQKISDIFMKLLQFPSITSVISFNHLFQTFNSIILFQLFFEVFSIKSFEPLFRPPIGQ